MTVYQIETRDKDYKSIIITASYERTRKALDTAEERNVDVIVTPYTLEDFDGQELSKMSKRVVGLDCETVDPLGYFPENCR